jgi:hypothetical protein
METGKWGMESDEEESLQTKDKVEKSKKENTKPSPQLETKSWAEHAKKFHSFGPGRDRVKPSEWWILL